MQMLVGKEREPITPLLYKIRHIVREYDCSFVLVVGGCGDYLDVADTVISMDSYEPKDVTAHAKQIAQTYPTGLVLEGGNSFGTFRRRVPVVPDSSGTAATPAKRSLDEAELDDQDEVDLDPPEVTGRPVKTRIHTSSNVTLFGRELDLSSLQITSVSQTRFISLAIPYLRDHVLKSAPPPGQTHWTVRSVVDKLETDIERHGVEVVSQWFREGKPEGDLAKCRSVEVAAALSRLRGVGGKWGQTSGGLI
ncbi:hypothetical protein HDU93_005036 [Gonapodya sp. JEL0774]|nr:hypothetical protein HDU93_005036 [Gonapodya sp. JEL0774]